MTETQEPEVTKESLLALAADFDAGKDIDSQDARPAKGAAVSTEAKPVAKADATEKAETKATDEPKDGTEVTTDSKPKADDAPKAEASKWAKNEERKAKTWQELNAEKEQLRKEKEELARTRAEIEQAKRAASTPEPVRDEHGATVNDYREAAKAFRAKGQNDMADAAEKLASNLATKEQQVHAQRAYEQANKQWQENYAKLCDSKPDLKDPNSDLYKAAVQALNDFPILKNDPQGIVYAVKAAELNLQARNFDGTKKELDALKAEHAKLQKKLSIGSGTPTETLSEEKSFDNMTQAERRKALEKAVHSFDREAGFAD